MEYTGAFSCRNGKCFESTASCPCWIEVVLTNTESGEVKIDKRCIFQALPMLMVEVIKASNRPAAAVESTRNEIVGGFAKLAGAFQQTIDAHKHLTGGI